MPSFYKLYYFRVPNNWGGGLGIPEGIRKLLENY